MVTIRVGLNLPGLNRLMTGPEAQSAVDRRGEAIARAAGENFEYVHSARNHPWVARGYVQPKNAAGRREEAQSKRLTRAVKAAGS